MLKILAPFLFFTLASIHSVPVTHSAVAQFEDKRDGQVYEYAEVNELNWMLENLRYKTPKSICNNKDAPLCYKCGQFYLVEDAETACPAGWRLPTKKEVKALFKAVKKNQLDLPQTLRIDLCGRIDNGKISDTGLQNTFWLNEEVKHGDVDHWHSFGDEQKIHNHNVTNAKRQFPVRCVCEAK